MRENLAKNASISWNFPEARIAGCSFGGWESGEIPTTQRGWRQIYPVVVIMVDGSAGAVENAGESKGANNGETAMDCGLWWELKYTEYFVKTMHTQHGILNWVDWD